MNIKRYVTGIGAAILVCALGPTTHALESTGMPQGFVCGMSYVDVSRSPWPFNGVICVRQFDGYCQVGNETPAHTVGLTSSCGLATSTLPGFFTFSDGDRGLASGFGYYHQSWNKMNATPSTMYRLPAGTACGFKESCNNIGQTCMGMDSNVGCPAGWVRKWANDMNAPSGCKYVWCEYQDPNQLCVNQSCMTDNQPAGTVCGITDSRKTWPYDNSGGQCMGMAPTPASCAEIGYQFHGFYDSGSPSGVGVGLCMKP